MEHEQIIHSLDEEIARLMTAKQLLTGEPPTEHKRVRTVSDEARQRMKEAQRKRWAAVKATKAVKRKQKLVTA